MKKWYFHFFVSWRLCQFYNFPKNFRNLFSKKILIFTKNNKKLLYWFLLTIYKSIFVWPNFGCFSSKVYSHNYELFKSNVFWGLASQIEEFLMKQIHDIFLQVLDHFRTFFGFSFSGPSSNLGPFSPFLAHLDLF